MALKIATKPGTRLLTRAAVLLQKGGEFVIREVEIEEPRADEVLVRMVATGICTTDVHVKDQLVATPLPAILGHEGAGVVERVGSAVTHVKPGDHVVLSYHACGQCKPCLSSHAAYCDYIWEANFAGARLDGTVGLGSDGIENLHCHFFGQSSFSTYALAHRRNTIKVPHDVPLDLLGPLGCGFQTGAGAVLKAMNVPLGASMAIFGVGAVGLAAIMAAKVASAETIIAIDVNAERLKVASSLGATHVVNVHEVGDIAAAVKSIEPRGVEFVLDTSGRKENLDAGIGALASMGRFGFVAFSEHSGAVVDASRLTVGQTLQGIIQGDAVPALMIPELIGLYRSGSFPIDRLITFYDFADINRAFEDLVAGRVIKAVLRFGAPTATATT